MLFAEGGFINGERTPDLPRGKGVLAGLDPSNMSPAHLYRAASPVGWTRIEGPLKPRAFAPMDKAPLGGDYLAGRLPILGNDDTLIAVARLATPMPYFFRNADADEVLFVHAGAGTLESDFGPLAYVRGDYLVRADGE